MPNIDILITIKENEVDATASITIGSETTPLPTTIPKPAGRVINVALTATLPEERNVGKLLSLGLFYPAVLGYFIFEIFHSLAAFNEFSGLRLAFKDHPSILVCKIILVAGTLCFYSCDFVNSTFAKKYSWDSLLIDFLIMIVVVVCFNSLQLSLEDSKEFLPVYFNAGYALFMFFYLIRYCLTRKRMDKKELLWYTKIALLEVGLLILFTFLSVFNFLFYTNQVTWPLWLTCGGVVLSCAIYVKVIRTRYQLGKHF